MVLKVSAVKQPENVGNRKRPNHLPNQSTSNSYRLGVVWFSGFNCLNSSTSCRLCGLRSAANTDKAVYIADKGFTLITETAADQSDIINGIQTASHFQCLTS